MTYLRATVANWDIDLTSAAGQDMVRQIEEGGVAVFRQQPGFIRYRLMQADARTTVAVAEWESEDLGRAGAQRYREWMRSSGIMEHLSLRTYDGPVVVAS
jgi:heme-degrading monooxygenase HmoA